MYYTCNLLLQVLVGVRYPLLDPVQVDHQLLIKTARNLLTKCVKLSKKKEYIKHLEFLYSNQSISGVILSYDHFFIFFYP
jgi:hypothetical protein